MTDKEKLVELLYSADLNFLVKRRTQRGSTTIDAVADHLIANGVTIQKWVSVEEQLPDVNKKVLVHYESGRVEIDFRLPWGGFVLEDLYGKVTHWMPLPESPKGEHGENGQAPNYETEA